jgi:hypothetical protein
MNKRLVTMLLAVLAGTTPCLLAADAVPKRRLLFTEYGTRS